MPAPLLFVPEMCPVLTTLTLTCNWSNVEALTALAGCLRLRHLALSLAGPVPLPSRPNRPEPGPSRSWLLLLAALQQLRGLRSLALTLKEGRAASASRTEIPSALFKAVAAMTSLHTLALHCLPVPVVAPPVLELFARLGRLTTLHISTTRARRSVEAPPPGESFNAAYYRQAMRQQMVEHAEGQRAWDSAANVLRGQLPCCKITLEHSFQY